MQIPGVKGKGVTTIDEHEATTWHAIVGAVPLLPKPVQKDLQSLVTYVLNIRDRRG